MMSLIGSDPCRKDPQVGFTPIRRLNVSIKSGSPCGELTSTEIVDFDRDVTPWGAPTDRWQAGKIWKKKPLIGSVLFSGSGFTLIELLFVILIMAVVVGFSVPRFSRTFRHLQLQVFTSDVTKLFAYASMRAVARGEMLRIHFDVEGGRYWIALVNGDSEEGESERLANRFGRISSVPKAISIEPSAREVTFYPDGRADPLEMSILDDHQEGYQLVTNVWTGRVKLVETHGYDSR